MAFRSEVDDVEALDRYLEAIVERRFPTVPRPAETAVSQPPKPTSRKSRPTTKLHSSSASSDAPATNNCTPKRPRTASVSAERSRLEQRTPAPTSSSSLRKKHDKRSHKQKSRHPTSRPSSPIVLKLRLKAPEDDSDDPAPNSSRPPSSYRSNRRTLKSQLSTDHVQHDVSDVQAGSSNDASVRKKTHDSFKRKRRPKTSYHHDEEHSTQEKFATTQEPSRESTPLRSDAKRKTKFRKKKQRKRLRPTTSNGSLAQSDSDSEHPREHRSEHSDESTRNQSFRKRRRVLPAKEESRREETISGVRRVPVKLLRSDSSPALRDGMNIKKGDKDKVPAASKSRRDEENEVKHAPDPLTSLLAFARNSGALSTVENMNKGEIIKHRQSLATIPGCQKFKSFSLFRYCRALCHHHKQALESKKTSYDGHALKGKELDALSYEIDEDMWREWIVGKGHQSGLCPPGLPKMSDAIHFVWRLLEVTASSEDDIAESFMESWYGEGLTVELAKLSLSAMQFWYNSKRDKAENEENHSELIEWIIRLVINIVVYELSPSSFISKVKNLKPTSLFISMLHSSSDESTFLSFESLLSYSKEFVSACPSNLGKECKNAVSELMQVFILRNGIPWNNNSPQRDAWQQISAESQKLPQILCEQEFFWSNPFTMSLQQVRREPLAADCCYEVGFLVNVVSSPLFMREVLQNQSKCLVLLCDVMTKSLEVMAREPLMAFRTILNNEKNFPSVPTVLDFLQTLMSSAVMQRELLATDVKIKELFLSSVNLLLIRSARMGSTMNFQHKLESLANHGLFGSREMDSIVDVPVASSAISQEKAMTRQRVVAFNAFLLASMGKSLEDGSRDMSQMNTLKAFLRSKAANTRNRKRTWEVVLRIQGGLDDHYYDHGVKKSVFSPEDRNHFTMVVEAIRKHYQKSSTDYSKTPSSVDEKSSSSIDVTLPRRRASSVSFPPITNNNLLCRAASQRKGHLNLDDDPQLLRLAQNIIKEEAQQTLARYDPESEFAWKWVRLQRKNAYIGGARELLEKNDRALGQKCTCLPGNAKEKKDGSENRVACSNELCENRHLRIECVPGECGAGSYCQNQRLQRLEYAKFKMTSFEHKGVGLMADEDIRAGDLIGEYQGEVISMETFKERMREYQGERHFYFMTLTNKLVIDASRKSQATRFLNHSCDPNAETQKWNAGGEPRVGIYAVRDISKGEEITFDYGARSIEKGSAPCVCGSSKCRGTLTSKREDLNVKASSSKGPKVEGVDQEKPRDLQEKTNAGEEEHAQDVEKIVLTKIDLAKKDLTRASELGLVVAEKEKRQKNRSEARLSPGATERLKTWKEAMKKLKQPKSTASLAGHEVDSSVRIPRRNAFNSTSGADNQTFSKAQDDLQKRSGLPSESDATSKIPRSSLVSVPRVPRRSSLLTDLRPRVPLSKLPGSTIIAQKASQSSLEKNIDSERPLSKAALIGREQGFQPSSTRHKRKPLKPKVKKRAKTRKADSDNDSMGEYSTASEAEPVMDEAPLSPSQLPDGQGARSDDEFVPESPLDQLHVHREDSKPVNQNRNEHADQEGYNRRRGETHIPVPPQRPTALEDPRGGQVHSMPENPSRYSQFPRPDLERGHYVEREGDHRRHPQRAIGMRSSEFPPMEPHGPHAARARMMSRDAPGNPPRSFGRESGEIRGNQSGWQKDRPHREMEYRERDLRFSQEPIHRTPPKFAKERDAARDYGRNRYERPRFSDGGRNEPFQRHGRYNPRDRGYPSHGYDEGPRFRERQRWANAIREEPIRGWDAGKGPHDLPQPRPPHDIPPSKREPHNQEHPLRSRHKEHFPRFAPPDIGVGGSQPGQKPERGVDVSNAKRIVAKAPFIGEKHAPEVQIGKRDQSLTSHVQGERGTMACRFSHPSLRSDALSTAIADGKPKKVADEALELKPPASTESGLGSKVEAKACAGSEATNKSIDAAPRKGTESSPREHQLVAPRSSAGGSSKDASQAVLEHSKSCGVEQVSEAVGEAAKQNSSQKRNDEAKRSAAASHDVGGSAETRKWASGREEIRRSRFHGDELRSGGNKRITRDGDAYDRAGASQVKRRKEEHDGRASGMTGKTARPSVGRGSHGSNDVFSKQTLRHGESREHEGRDRWKRVEGQEGHGDNGFRRRNSEGHREERKRGRYRSPGKHPKKKKKSGRDGPRQSGLGEKGREDAKRSQPIVGVVRGSTHKDLRSLLGKGRSTE
ncbi:unnamed protein product [Agarophyton chilense]